MFSYVFMKILERRPERYDMGINILSANHAKRIRRQIIQNYVKPDMEVLDIGCGTGSLIIDAAEAGAKATGIDISKGMLAVAQKRIADNEFRDKITLHNVGTVEIDSLFAEDSFDLIISTLVFSGLYAEERALALLQIRKLLKPEGILVIALEVRPRELTKRFIHSVVRFPLALLTYLIAQTGTKPLIQINDEIIDAGLNIIHEERPFLDSFILLAASKPAQGTFEHIALPGTLNPKDDLSLIKSVWNFIGRWFPNPVEPGLRIIGSPHRKSPVIVTSNFHLTVRRVEKYLYGENVFLLVAPANGINVWCASCGGELNTHSVITVIKTSRIKERVDHHQIILPQFSAPGIDLKLLREETKFNGVFGPAYAKDIPVFIKDRKTVIEHNKAEFSLPFRLEMLISMNFLVWIIMGILTLLIIPSLFLPFTASFWLAGFVLYAGYPVIPGRSGWFKAGVLSVIEIIAIALFSSIVLQKHSFSFWEMMIMVSVINVWLGFDLKGIVTGNPSEAEWLLRRLGITSIGHIFSAKDYSPGKLQQELTKCNNCQTCLLVCPKGVFEAEVENRVIVKNRQDCLACRACVTQCPENALLLEEK